ncbi:hypothetical protein [Pseudomonas corrugata]
MRYPIVFMQTLVLTLLFASVPTLAVTGPEVAQLLNNRYKNTVTECPVNKPAYFCSGVLVRGSQGSDTFWTHDAASIQSGAERFNYLRADLDTRQLSQKNGIVFSDSFTAIGVGKSLDVLCAYPFEMTVSGHRPDHGCGLPTATNTTQDPSSCAALGISDASSWLTHFQQQTQQPEQQCSLSSRVAAQFKASLVAHQLIDSEWAAKPNLLQIRNWDAQAPERLPLQGLFYDTTQTGALLDAQKDQRDYFTATGEWLPVLRMDLNRAPDAVFGFNTQDQLYAGYQVASRLNARYANTAAACQGDTPAYNCSGVLIRTTDASLDFRAWNPSPGSIQRNGVSFSYMRADVYVPKLAWAKNQGLILKELAAPTAHPLTVRCAYPYDGATFYRSDSCNEHSGAPQTSIPCAEQGITDEHQWLAHFNALASKHTLCSFTGETIPFDVSLKARALLDPAVQREQNEIILAKWPQDIGEQLPLEAFFYTTVAAKPNAVFFQKDYFLHTGRFLPVVGVDLSATDGSVFSFNPDDQIAPLSASVKEANGNTLDPVNAEDSLTVRVPSNIGLLPDDKLKVTWAGAPGTPAGGSYTSDESLVSAGLEIPIPNTVVAFNLGQSVTVTYTFIRNNVESPASIPLSLTVLPLSQDDLLVSKPKILQAANNGEGPELDLALANPDVELRIEGWPHMAKNQYVWLRLRGEKTDGTRHDYTVWKAPSRVTPSEYDRRYLKAPVPYSYLQALRDGSVLSVEFKAALSQSTDESQAVTFPLRTYTVHGQVLPFPPSVKEADGTTLNPIDAEDSLTVMVPTSIGLLPDDKLKVTWAGAPGTPAGGSYTSDESLVSAGLEIPIPNTVMAFNLGKSVTVTYTVIHHNVEPATSIPLSLMVLPLSQDDLLRAKPKILQAANNGDGPELDVNTLTGSASVRIDSWPHIAAGQYVWLHLAGTNIDGSDYERTLWGDANGSRVSDKWVSDGFATNSTASLGDLQGLRDGSTLTVGFKAAFDQRNVEAEAVTFPSRTYTIRGKQE